MLLCQCATIEAEHTPKIHFEGKCQTFHYPWIRFACTKTTQEKQQQRHSQRSRYHQPNIPTGWWLPTFLINAPPCFWDDNIKQRMAHLVEGADRDWMELAHCMYLKFLKNAIAFLRLEFMGKPGPLRCQCEQGQGLCPGHEPGHPSLTWSWNCEHDLQQRCGDSPGIPSFGVHGKTRSPQMPMWTGTGPLPWPWAWPSFFDLKLELRTWFATTVWGQPWHNIQKMAEKTHCQIRSTRRILRLGDATDFAELLQ